MERLKDVLAKQMVGKTLKFHCNCIAFNDIVGTVVGYYTLSNEIIFKVSRSTDGKIFDIGENHPSMEVEEL